MDPVTVILGGITISVISGAVGKVWGNGSKVKQSTCIERRLSCSTLLTLKIDSLARDIKEIKEAVKVNKSVQKLNNL